MNDLENISDDVLRKLSTNDLRFLSENKLEQISTQGLQILQQGIQPTPLDVPTPQNLAIQPPGFVAQQPERTMSDVALGVGETALSTLTGIPAAVIGQFGALPTALSPENYGTTEGAQRAMQRAGEIAGGLTYQPRTVAGQEYTGQVADIAQQSGIAGLAGMGNIGRGLPKATQVTSQKPGVTAQTLGLTTGTGGEAISQAYKAGQGKNKAFLANLRGEVPVETVLQDAKQALATMKANRSAQYVANKEGWASDSTPIDFKPVEQAMKDFEDSLKVGKQWKIGKKELAKVKEVKKVVSDWKKAPLLHNTIGLDALKQRIDAIYPEATESRAQIVVDGMRNKVKDLIVSQRPDYADAMQDYEVMTTTIKDIESALSLGNRASKDTALRKLQSLTRNNVATNYGGRLDLANELERQGGVNLMPSVAGQALNPITPRGLAGQIGGVGGLFSVLSGLVNPANVAGLTLASPRIMGEASYRVGQASGLIPRTRIPYNQASTAGLIGSMLADEQEQQ